MFVSMADGALAKVMNSAFSTGVGKLDPCRNIGNHLYVSPVSGLCPATPDANLAGHELILRRCVQ